MTSTTTTRLSENEIRPQELMSEQQRRFANDIDRLHEHLGRFVKVACPACGGKDSHFEWEKYKLSYVSCANCRTIYINPRPPPDVLEHYYRNSENYAYWNDVIFPASEDVRREKLFKPRAERLIDICRRHGGEGGTLLEVGAGFGTFGHCPGRCGLQPAPSGQSGQQIGKDFDAKLEALGAKRIAAREDCDVDFEDGFTAWLDRSLTALAPGVTVVSEPTPATAASSSVMAAVPVTVPPGVVGGMRTGPV
jgi:ribosomal protein S27E